MPSQASIPALTEDINLYFRVLLSFALGALLSLLITSVSYRRDHYKEIRKSLDEAVRDVAKCSVIFWASEFNATNGAYLQGAVTYLQHILPSSLILFNKRDVEIFENLFADLTDITLGREDFNKSCHEIDLKRVLQAQTICAAFVADYGRVYLGKVRLLSLVKLTFIDLGLEAKILSSKSYYYLKLHLPKLFLNLKTRLQNRWMRK